MLYGVLAVLGVAWLVVLVVNGVRVVQVMRLEQAEEPKNAAWIAWGLSVAGMFTGCCVAMIAWVVMQFVLPPIDAHEDSLGTIQLYDRARSNITFVIVGNIGLLLLAAAATAVVRAV